MYKMDKFSFIIPHYYTNLAPDLIPQRRISLAKVNLKHSCV